MDLVVEGHLAPTDHRQWEAMEVGGDEDDRLRHEEAGADEAGEGAEGVEAATSGSGRAHSRGLGVGRHGGACRDHRTVDRHQGHHPVAEAVGVEVGVEAAAMGEENPRPEEADEADEAVVAGEAQAMTRTTAHDRGAEVGAEDKEKIE